jgi:hypothetical protein
VYEHKRQRLLSRHQFFRRVLNHLLVSGGAILVALGIGVSGYHFIAHLSWINSLLNASMILGGMGPVDPLDGDAAKVFASLYALFAGLVFVGLAGLLLGPFLHRLMHHFHVDATKDSPEK